jgi:hypothetical protein
MFTLETELEMAVRSAGPDVENTGTEVELRLREPRR